MTCTNMNKICMNLLDKRYFLEHKHTKQGVGLC
jgi:hypothetical protein